MTLEDKVKERISEAPLGSDEKNCLRCILGELTSKKGSGIAVLRELLRQNEEAMRRTRRNREELNRIEIENTVLKSLLEE
jgi:hypothetical protein